MALAEVAGTDSGGTIENGAHEHRKMKEQSRPARRARVFAVTSGKGGVGKTTFVINTAVELALQKNRADFSKNRVLVIDTDIGLANLHLRFYRNIHEKGTIMTLLQSEKKGEALIEEARRICYRPSEDMELYILAGSCADDDIFRLTSHMKEEFENLFMTLVREYDYIIFDCGAGITRTNNFFEAISDEILVCTNYEEAAVLGAYAKIKLNVLHNARTSFGLVVNKADRSEGESCFKTLDRLVSEKLKVYVNYLGNIRKDDGLLKKSTSARMPVFFLDRNSEVRKDYCALSLKMLKEPPPEAPERKDTDFLQRIKDLFIRKQDDRP